MQIIPVIDLKNGIVVHARQGNRDSYAPLVSKLCETADIFDVIHAYRQLYGFDILYIADLNAILGDRSHAALLTKILQNHPDIEFWIDAGYPLPGNYWLNLANYRPVLGSESLTDSTVDQVFRFNNNFILSLDHSATGEMGASSLFRNPAFWPENVIIMSLPHVGSNGGPDTVRLKHYRQTYPQQSFVAAGGVRNPADLQALEAIGIKQCLVASALHNGNINPHDIAEFEAKKYPDERGIF